MAVAEHTSPAPIAAGDREEPLAVADGVELLGEFEDSGFREPPLLARRADGQIVQLTQLLHAVAAECDGTRDDEAVARAVTARYGRGVSARNVRFLVATQLRPLGVLKLGDGSNPAVARREPLMALRHRRPLVPEHAVGVVARALAWLHHPLVQGLLLAALALFDVWLFAIHGIAAPVRAALYDPALLLLVLGGIIAATAFHEIGHASACRYGGARPGVMGVGVYLVWPAFYCDVTESYRLGRAGRLRTDLGGVYFNAIFALLMGAAYFHTGQEALLLVAAVQHVIALQQLLPLLRFDGYYVLSDLTGVPDILSRIKPIFRSLVPGRGSEPAVRELKPWVRVVVTAYLLALVPALALIVGWIVLVAPRILATVYDSFGLQLDRLAGASGPAEIGVAALRLAALCLPVAAMALSLGRSGRMAGRGLMTWSSRSGPRRIAVIALAIVTLGALGSLWWPNGEYQPIRPGERGTIGEAVSSVPDLGGGRPSFTPAREQAYGAVPTVRQHGLGTDRAPRDADEAPAASPSPAGAEPRGLDDEDIPEGFDGSGGYDEESGPAGSATPDATPQPSATPSPPPASTAPAESATPSPTAAEPTPTPTPTATATPSPTSPTSTAVSSPTAPAPAIPSVTATPSPTQ